jgi:hypothetical protein
VGLERSTVRRVPNVVFVAPYAMEATVRFIDALARTDGVRLGLVSSDPLEAFPPAVRLAVAAHWRIDDCLDVDQLTAGVAGLGERLGSVDRLTAILENLQVPLGAARERLGIDGITAATADNFRDKARMKAAFAAAGVPCARNRGVHTPEGARAFAGEVGYPFVVKPLAGAGARNTFRVADDGQLERWLDVDAPSSAQPVQLEEFVTGAEHSFDSVVIDGRLVWASVSHYLPSPLDVLEHPWIQWCVVLPRELGAEYADIMSVGPHAVTSLGLRTGLSHMEWFRRPDGSLAVSEVGARPPGAQIMSLMSYAHDVDMHAAWARLVADGSFDAPERRWAVGAAYLRAQGEGRTIVAAHGLERISEDTKALVVDVRLPSVGTTPSGTYEGDGSIIVRAPDTAAVERALTEIISSVRLECR